MPDKVPFVTGTGYFPAKSTGIGSEAGCCICGERLTAYHRILRDFQSGIYTFQQCTSGETLGYLELQTFGWSGYRFSRYHLQSLDDGLIVCPRSSPGEVNTETFWTIIELTREYGVYD